MLTYKILGPLEVDRDGESLPLGPAKQRALLARLLLSPNETVSKDRLIDDLWGQSPPARAEQNLFQHVFRLRKALDDGGRTVILTRDPGYLIQLGAEDELDARRFEDLQTRSHGELEEEPARALATLDEALALWRGPALVEFAYENFAQAEATRLDELHIAAEEGRMEALLALRRHKEAIPRLRALVHTHPTREHLHALLALALYRAGRQTDALNEIQSARKVLSAEYGIDVGPELRQLEEAILRQDPELDLSVIPEPPTIETVPTLIRADVPVSAGRRRHAQRRRAGRVVGVTAIALVLSVIIAVAVLSGDPPEPTPGEDTDVPAPAPPVTGLSLSWNKAATENLVAKNEQRLLGGIETDRGFVAYGFTVGPSEYDDRDYDTAAWFGRPQGQGWYPSSSDLFMGPGNGRAATAWHFDDDTVVLLGWVQSAEFDAAVWRRPPGSSDWQRIADQEQALGGVGDQQIRDATLSDSTLVAVGFTTGDQRDGAIWEGLKSGRQWTYRQGDLPMESGDQQMMTVATTKSGLIAVAGHSTVDGDRDAAVWRRGPSEVWKRVRGQDALEGDGSQQINELTAYQGGFIAVGEQTIDGETDAVVWSSSNGRDWERLPDPGAVFGGSGDQHMYTVAASSLGLVAAGSEVTEEDTDAAVWTSIDGITWERLPGHAPTMTALTDVALQEIKGLIPFDEGFLAFGAEGTTKDELDARVWIGTPIT